MSIIIFSFLSIYIDKFWHLLFPKLIVRHFILLFQGYFVLWILKKTSTHSLHCTTLKLPPPQCTVVPRCTVLQCLDHRPRRLFSKHYPSKTKVRPQAIAVQSQKHVATILVHLPYISPFTGQIGNQMETAITGDQQHYWWLHNKETFFLEEIFTSKVVQLMPCWGFAHHSAWIVDCM